MLEDFEGSRTEFMKMLAEQDAPPAYIQRAQRVEQIWNELLNQCRQEFAERLEMPRVRLAQLAALIDHNWSTLAVYLLDDDAPPYLETLHAEWKPKLRLPLEATTSQRRITASLKDLIRSFERLNSRWESFLSTVDLADVNYERQQYNDYYLVEKAAALGSDKLAEMGFQRLAPATEEDLRQQLPALRVPRLR